MRGTDVPARSRNECVFGCESSRGLACVLVRCSLYPWASGSACRVDIEGGAVLGSLFLAKILPCASYKRPWAARSGSRLRLAGPTRHQGSIWAPVIIRFPRRRRPMRCCREMFTLSFGATTLVCQTLVGGPRRGFQGSRARAGWSGRRLGRALLDLARSNADGRPARMIIREVAASRIAEQL